jgi:Arc/MetJ family transcription regulator
MRTTLDLDSKLLDEAMKATGSTTKTAVVHQGLEALVERAARKRLAALYGGIPEAKASRRRRPRPVERG